jgi:uncharacterized protein with PIN domain
MIVDASAAIAVLKEEPEAGRFLRELTASAGPKRMSAANYCEAAIAVDSNRNPLLSRRSTTWSHKPESPSSRWTASRPRSPARPIATLEKAAVIRRA